jgi:cytoskeletal protein RodZ
MDDNLGSIFSEARKAKGISIDDAAEILRIKAEYLENIENGIFDFNLPSIYRRGFYKSYADFLDLNLEEMMAQCPIKPFETFESSPKRRDMISQVAKKTQEIDHEKIKTSFTDDIDEITASGEVRTASKFDRAVLLKIAGIVAVAVLVFALLLHAVISVVSRPSLPLEKTKVEVITEKSIVVRANGDIKLMIRLEENKEKLFSGAMKKGDTKPITYKTPIQIYFDHGEFLVIELANGEILHPDSGRGGIQIK